FNLRDCPSNVMVTRSGNSPERSNSNHNSDSADTFFRNNNNNSQFAITNYDSTSFGATATAPHTTNNRAIWTTNVPNRQGNLRAANANAGNVGAGIATTAVPKGAEGNVANPGLNLAGGGAMSPASSQQYKNSAGRIGGGTVLIMELLMIVLLLSQ
ncbi:hypothetical protein SK128_007728, partial [Halocaridina rubra]